MGKKRTVAKLSSNTHSPYYSPRAPQRAVLDRDLASAPGEGSLPRPSASGSSRSSRTGGGLHRGRPIRRGRLRSTGRGLIDTFGSS